MDSQTDAKYWEPIAAKAIAEGKDLPHSWDFYFEDGEDGCMPIGWYAIGLDAGGSPIYWPVRHEYGPFADEEDAIEFSKGIQCAS